MDRNLARGLFLGAVALGFGLSSFQYGLGTLSRAGPGLFPLIVSTLLLVIAVATIVKSRFEATVPLALSLRNIGLLLGALCAFAIVSKLVNMTLGIVVMVFIAGRAGSATYSWWRNLKIAAALVGVAFAFHKLLGLALPLY